MGGAVRAGAVYFAAVFAAGFALGTLRVGLLEPALGPFLAVAVELPVMLAVSWAASGLLCRRFAVPPGGARAVMGAFAFALLIAAEAALGAALSGGGPGASVAHWATPAGALGLAGQAAFGAFPWLRGRLAA